MKRLNKHKKYLTALVIILFSVVFIIAPLNQTHASTGYSVIDVGGKVASKLVTWTLTKAVAGAVLTVNLIISFIGGLLLVLAGWLIDFALALNGQLFNTLAVRLGWQIVRDITNLFFVLGIIVIAFATIIRNQTYGLKQVLWKLIVMAVLINFSLSICGIFIDFSGVITDFFISKSTPQGIKDAGSFSWALSKSFQPQRLFELKSLVQSSGSDLTEVLTNIASVFFIIVFTFLAVVSFFALGIMLLIRFVYLAILLILAPIAWFTWIFPGLTVGGSGNIWSQWWAEFIRWTFFPAVMSFFMYLAIATMSATSNANQFIQNAADSAGGTNSAALAIANGIKIGSVDRSLTVVIGQMFVFIFLMMGGLIAANKLSITGAASAMKVANWGTGAMTNWGLNRAKGVGRNVGERIMTASTKDVGGEKTSGVQRLATRLATIPVLGKAFGGAAIGVNKLMESTKKQAEKIQADESSHKSNVQLLNDINTAIVTSPARRAADLAEAAKRGISSQVTAKAMAEALEATRKTNMQENVVQANPAMGLQYFNELGITQEKALRIIRDSMHKIEKTDDKNNVVVQAKDIMNATSPKFKELENEKLENEKQQQIIADLIAKGAQTTSTGQAQIQAAQYLRDNAKAEQQRILASLTDIEKDAYAILEYAKNSPAWPKP